MRKEYKKRNAMQNIKEIFLDAFTMTSLDQSKDIIEKLSNIVEKVTDANLDNNVKLIEWSKSRFQHKVNKKISSEIALSQVELAKKIDHVTKVLGNILSLYTKLCNTTPFTH